MKLLKLPKSIQHSHKSNNNRCFCVSYFGIWCWIISTFPVIIQTEKNRWPNKFLFVKISFSIFKVWLNHICNIVLEYIIYYFSFRFQIKVIDYQSLEKGPSWFYCWIIVYIFLLKFLAICNSMTISRDIKQVSFILSDLIWFLKSKYEFCFNFR